MSGDAVRKSPSAVLLLILAARVCAAQAPKASPAVTRDADHDGVPDMRDRCPGTPAGFVVDANGCPTGVMRQPAETAVAPPDGESVPRAAIRQAPATRRGTRVGIGAAVGGQAGTLVVPVLFAHGWSVEPSLGFDRSVNELSGLGAGRTTQSTLTLGVTIGVPIARFDSVRIYLAPQAGVGIIHQSSSGGVTNSPTRWFAGLGVGGEAFVSRRASAGAEIGAGYMHFRSDYGGGVSTVSYVLVDGRVALRWYFRE